MSVSIRNRRRVSLLASSSLVAASLLAGVAGLSSLVLAPGVAMAADECGNPSGNGGGNDVFVCAGPYVAIDYTATTNGNLTLNLEDGVSVLAGIAATGNAGESLTVRATTNVVGAGDPTVLNPLGYAINLQGQGPSVIVDLRSTDVGVDGLPGPSIGSGRGIQATNTAGSTQVRMNEGSVNAAAGFGINATSAGGGDTTVYLTNGTTVTSTGTAVRAISTGGQVDVITTGLLTTDNVGIFANGTTGVTISAGDILALGTGISATSTGGLVDVTTTGAVSGAAGIVTNSGTNNNTIVTLGGDVTGTAGNGVTGTVGDADYTLNATGVTITGTGGDGVNITSNGDGLITLNVSDVSGAAGIDVNATTGNTAVVVVSDGLITGVTGAGVQVDATGSVSITVNDTNAVGYGAVGDSTNGDATVIANGTLTGGGGIVAITNGSGTAFALVQAGATINTTDPFLFGALANATGGGDAILTVAGDVADGGIGASAVGAGTVDINGGGNVSMLSTFSAVAAATDTGLLFINLTGDVSSTDADGFLLTSNSGPITLFTSGVVTAGDDGVDALSTTGSVNINIIGSVTATDTGVLVTTGGAGVANINGSVTGATGVSVTGTGAGTATINLGGGSTVEATGAGFGAVATTTGSGDAAISTGGSVLDGGIGAFALGSGNVNVTGAGSINNTGAGPAVSTTSTTGTTTINLTGPISSSGGDGINALTGSGALTVGSTGAITAGTDGIQAVSTSGLVTVNTSGTIGAGATGITAVSNGGVDVNNGAVITAVATGIAGSGSGGVDLNTSANVTGATGITAVGTAGGTASITVQAGATVTGTAGDGANADSATGIAVIDNFGALVATGGDGAQATTTSGVAQVINESGATISATGGIGATASATTGVALVNDVGAGISGTTGVSATSTSGVALVISNNVTGTAGDGINASTTSGIAQVATAGMITSTGGDGIDASSSAGGLVVVVGSADIDASDGYGILARATAGGAVVVGYTGDIGTPGDPTANGGILALLSGGAGVVSVSSVNDIYTDGAGPFGAGVAGVHGGTSGTVNVSYQGTMVSGSVGVVGGIFGATNADTVTVTVGDNSSISAGVTGVLATNQGLGAATTIIGSGVTIDPDDYGSYTFSAANDATVTIGNNVVIVIGNTDGDNIAYGVYAESGQAVDDAVGDESVEITIGTGASITIDDGAGGDADGAGGVIGVATGAAGGIDIDIGDGLNVSITGNNAVGVGGSSVAGDIFITTGTGTIDILGLDNLDLTGNFPGTAGIGATSTSGDILIQSATSIAVNNGTLDAAGIFAESGGAGGVTVISTAQILSSDTGISAEAVNGDVVVNSSAFIGAVAGDGINALNTGTGNTQVFTTASITSTQANGIVALNTGTDGFVFVVASGGTITAGMNGIAAGATNAANTQIVQVNNSDAINANTSGGGGFGILGVQAGSGSLVINNSGAIGGTAVSGIVGLNSNALGQIAINNSGAIGSAGNAVTDNGIIGSANAGASINIQSTGGGIWAGVTGIRANSLSTGNVAVFTTAASPITVTGPGGAGIWVNTLGGTAEVANNAVIASAGAGIIATNTTGTITVATSGAVTATGGDAIFTSGTTGATTILANAALSGSDDGIDAAVTNAALTVTNNATVTGADNGILTSNGGTGVTTLNVNGNVTGSGAGSAGINAATTGTGAVNVLIANVRTIQDVNGSAIRTTSGGGAVTINTGAGSTIVGSGAGINGWVVDLNNAVGGTTTFNVGAGTIVRSTDVTTAGYDDNAIRGIGGSVIINNAGRINGRVLFSGLTGNVVFNNSSITSWHTTGASTFSAGADILNNTGAIFTNAGGVATSFDFGAGVDTFTQAGLLVVGEPAQGASTLTITNLEALNNSGRIVFGSAGVDLTALSDGQINDRILASGTTFTGSGSSRLVMDASLGGVVQTSCAVLTAADCLSLTGGSTAGSTLIKVTDASGSPFGAFNPVGIVLVDVAGAGVTAATHFSLDPTSSFWRADLSSPDGVLDKGLFFYDLTLNLNKQHVLVGLPDGEAFEFTTFGAALQNVWHTTTGVWFERQADLRTQLPALDDSGAGIWVKVTGSAAERDRIQGYDLFGVTYEFDTSYEQNTVALIGGLDFMGGGSGKAWVIGGQFGFVDSDVTYDNSPTVTSFEGTTFGVYGSYVAGPWFVDGIINANALDYDHQAITLAPVGSNIFSGSVDSLGFQVEGGWSVPIGANGFFEPLGSLSYVTTDVDAVDVPGAEVDFDSFTSLRASIGGRIGVDVDHGTFSSKWALVARYWNEFEGENDVTFHSAGPDFTLTDDFSGGFGEIGGTVNVFGADDRFSAFLNIGTKFQDDYKSVDGSIGLRWRW